MDMMTLAQRGFPKPDLNLEREKSNHHDIVDDRFWSILQKVHDYTELPTAALFNLYSAVRYVSDIGIAGDLVECGVHMGGSVMSIQYALLQGDACGPRRIYALDTFTGFLRRTEGLDVNMRTGADACVLDANSFDYTAPSTANMKSVGYEGLRIIKGDVLHSIPALRTEIEKIAILRLDTDSHDTTKFELENLYDRVVKDGVIIVDDYGYNVGCKKAVDDFVAGKRIMIQRINANVRSWVKT